jgi:PadR family transcriptional regulator PadR
MSRKMKRTSKTSFQAGSKKSERYIQPSILMALKCKSSYGYELIKEISQFGFMEGQAPPGMIYRHLRQMEDNGLVSSEWETEGTGPAKRVYRLTMEGSEVLEYWIDYMKKQAQRLQSFIEQYETIIKDGGSR